MRSSANELRRQVSIEVIANNLTHVHAVSDLNPEAIADTSRRESHRVVHNRDTFDTIRHFTKRERAVGEHRVAAISKNAIVAAK